MAGSVRRPVRIPPSSGSRASGHRARRGAWLPSPRGSRRACSIWTAFSRGRPGSTRRRGRRCSTTSCAIGPNRHGQPFEEFDRPTDYDEYVDGKPRLDGVRSFLVSRGVELPMGSPADPPQAETVHGLGTRKNDLVLELIHQQGVEPYEGSVPLRREGARPGAAPRGCLVEHQLPRRAGGRRDRPPLRGDNGRHRRRARAARGQARARHVPRGGAHARGAAVGGRGVRGRAGGRGGRPRRELRLGRRSRPHRARPRRCAGGAPTWSSRTSPSSCGNGDPRERRYG